MTYDIDFLKKAMDSVRNDPALKTKDGETFCNYNAFKVAQELGLALFWNNRNNRVMMANEMVSFMDANPQQFSKFTDHKRAWELTNEGYLIFAALADKPHGHIAPLYPSPGMETSGKWQAQVPFCSQVGARNDVMGLNYAFFLAPTYYLVC